MKTNLLILSFLILGVSCGSAPEKAPVKVADTQSTMEADELAWVKNSDFTPKKEVAFEPSKDNFKSLKVKNDILVRESVARLPQPVLQTVENNNDPLGTITSLCYQKKFNDALKLSRDKYQEFKAHPGYWNQVASCYLLQGDLKKARLYYLKSRDQNNQYAPPVNNLGVIYQREGDDQKALKAYEDASKIGSFTITPMFNLAQIYLRYGLVAKAHDLLNSLHTMSNRDVEVLGALGTLNMLENNLNEAIRFYSLIPPADLVRADLALNFSVALKLKGDDEQAMKIFRGIDKSNINVGNSYYENVAKYIGTSL